MTKYDPSITSVVYEDSVVFSMKLYFTAVLHKTAYGSVTCLIYKTDHTFVTLLFGNETFVQFMPSNACMAAATFFYFNKTWQICKLLCDK
jgi:hypothetical protein